MIAKQESKLNKRFVHREFLNLFRAGRVGQRKEMSAKKFASPSEGAAEGGCGGNSAAPEPEAKPRRLFVQNRAEQKNCLSLLEEFFGGARKSEIVKAIFLRGVPSHGTAAGRSGWFRSGISDKMSSSRVVKTHQNLTFGKLTDFFVGGAKRRPCVLHRHFLCARRGEPRLAPAQTEVRLPRDLEILSRICFAQFKNI
jgi:hypothetical protein